MVYPCNKLILRNKKEITIDTYSLKQTQEHYDKKKKPGTKDYIFYDYPYMQSLEEAELQRKRRQTGVCLSWGWEQGLVGMRELFMMMEVF